MNALETLSNMLTAEDSVLEIGCGDGALLKELKSSVGVKISGVDPYAGYGTKRKWDCYPIAGEDVNSLDKKFNLIYSVHSFHHLTSPIKFLHSARKILAPGGIVVIIDWRYGAITGVPERYFMEQELKSFFIESGFLPLTYWLDDDDQIIIGAPFNELQIAVASDGKVIPTTILGRSPFYEIFRYGGEKIELVETVENPIASENPAGKTFEIIKLLHKCQILVAALIGGKGDRRVEKSGKLFIKVKAGVDTKTTAMKIIRELKEKLSK